MGRFGDNLMMIQEEEAMRELHEDEREIWDEAYCAALATGEATPMAALIADTAVQDWRKEGVSRIDQ